MLQEKLKALLGLTTRGNQAPRIHDPVETLRLSYHDLLRLAQQIDAHAERAPYPHVAQRLRRIAAEKRQSAQALREKLVTWGGEPEAQPLEINSGKNHWERINRDMEDQKLLESQLLERASLLAEHAPEVGNLLQQAVAAGLSHKETLLDLVARADPQAEQT